ncbi:ATP-binding protein [Reichenbachiella sp. MALMAid0571]|uniref:ATP-binding protein n=1 Tax=Reichenbachiella sp. MALMAid0571 TaxID=3143939 RepID=UPI0032DF6C18
MKKIKVAVVGPESSGKSTLVKELASLFQCDYVEEYARQYIQNLDRPYSYRDLQIIAKKQMKQENEAFVNSDHMLICDSSLITIKVWSYDKFGKCEKWIEQQLGMEKYDLMLLCKPDLPWQPDPLREDEHRREYLFHIYSSYLKQNNQSYKVVEGKGVQRTNLAADFVSELLNDLK